MFECTYRFYSLTFRKQSNFIIRVTHQYSLYTVCQVLCGCTVYTQYVRCSLSSVCTVFSALLPWWDEYYGSNLYSFCFILFYIQYFLWRVRFMTLLNVLHIAPDYKVYDHFPISFVGCNISYRSLISGLQLSGSPMRRLPKKVFLIQC